MNDADVRGYAAARQALAGPDLGRAALRTGGGADEHVLNMEGEDHARHRRAVDAALDTAVSARLPGIVRLIGHVVDDLPAGEPVDAAERLAYPVAIGVVDLVVGLGGEYAYWAAVARAIDTDQAGLHSGLHSVLDDALHRLAAGTPPPGTVAAELARAPAGENPLSRSEVAANLLFAASAGFTNLANAIGGAVRALGRDPDAYAWLAADPAARLACATDELLRYAEPAERSSTRRAAQDTVVGGDVIAAGRTVRIWKAAANRDPARYAYPERLDLGRTPNPHLSFGYGRHYCPAAQLSRLVLDRVLLGLTRRFAAIEPIGPEGTAGPQGTAGPEETAGPEGTAGPGETSESGRVWDSYHGSPLMLRFIAKATQQL
ncbi:cytochrome P450 [Hamadaea tsunoensis]|uniref:cytochrome P450 n=1 Tax=Hamadaea tsunoensis TaxID=53368 RepID=UPI00041025AB|nr:cytochrome P450 [Hamadaea tsunoensis]